MRFKKTVELINYLDYLIRNRTTGTPKILANKLGVSVRSVFYYLSLLKDLGAPVKWSPCEETYIYDESIELSIINDLIIIRYNNVNGPQCLNKNNPGRQENYINH